MHIRSYVYHIPLSMALEVGQGYGYNLHDRCQQRALNEDWHIVITEWTLNSRPWIGSWTLASFPSHSRI